MDILNFITKCLKIAEGLCQPLTCEMSSVKVMGNLLQKNLFRKVKREIAVIN